MSLPWFRLYSEFAGDPVIQSLAFEDQRHYVLILCLKCNGLLDRSVTATRREPIIARALGLDAASAEEAKRRLMEVNLIDRKWQPLAWNKRQYISDNSTERVRKYRNNKEKRNVTETLRNSDSNTPDTDTDTEAETYTETPTTGDKSPASAVPFQQIVDLYHQLLPELPKVAKLTKTRQGYVRQRWLEDLAKLENWHNFFTHVRQSAFLMGKSEGNNGRPPFRADLEWLCKPANFVKIAEGKYHV